MTKQKSLCCYFPSNYLGMSSGWWSTSAFKMFKIQVFFMVFPTWNVIDKKLTRIRNRNTRSTKKPQRNTHNVLRNAAGKQFLSQDILVLCLFFIGSIGTFWSILFFRNWDWSLILWSVKNENTKFKIKHY